MVKNIKLPRAKIGLLSGNMTGLEGSKVAFVFTRLSFAFNKMRIANCGMEHQLVVCLLRNSATGISLS
jgi:hypothetical protein